MTDQRTGLVWVELRPKHWVSECKRFSLWWVENPPLDHDSFWVLYDWFVPKRFQSESFETCRATAESRVQKGVGK